MDDAVKAYEARLQKSPDDRTLLYILAEAQRTYQKNADRSVEIGEKLAEVEKKFGKKVDVPEQALLAGQYVKAGKLKQGAELFEVIAPLDPKLEAWHLKEAATTWLKAKDNDKALAAARKSGKAAVPEKRSEQLTHFWHRALGDVFLEAGEPKEAIPHYQHAITSTKIAGYVKDCQAKLAKAEAAAKQ
jgi:tetratricopeptide (TPR) repeat protein